MEGLVFSKEWKEKSPLWLRMELSENKKFSFSASEDGENFCPVGPAFHLEKGTWTGANSAFGPVTAEMNRQEDGVNMITYTSATRQNAEEAFEAAWQVI